MKVLFADVDRPVRWRSSHRALPCVTERTQFRALDKLNVVTEQVDDQVCLLVSDAIHRLFPRFPRRQR